MPVLVVTGTAEVDGQVVTGTAYAEVAAAPARNPRADARHLLALAELIERHAGEFRRDLERLAAGIEERGEEEAGHFGWFHPEPKRM